MKVDSDKVLNWATPEQIDHMKERGWRIVGARELPKEGRTVIRLLHPEDKVETHRSLRI